MSTQANSPASNAAKHVHLTFQLGSYGSRSRLSDATPAIDAMVDLRNYHGPVIRGDAQLDRAAISMEDLGTHLAVIVDEDGRLQGILDVADVLGEKPMQVAQKRGITHAELSVEHVMTTTESIEVLPLDSLNKLTALAVFRRLKSNGHLYAVVVDETNQTIGQVCGIFSLRELAHALRQQYLPLAASHSFAELEAAIAA